ncbi:MAG TPA: T9SS type A sorting domain-containing protein [Bacteroidota bacterium]|nr:T9SS type A sorting domain-containing protein [Bacteroidota bacterium]
MSNNLTVPGTLVLVFFALLQTSEATQRFVAPPHKISDTVAIAQSGDTIMISAGTYTENVTLSKKLVLIGAGSSTVITPSSGNGISINSGVSGVILQSLRVAHATSSGISASGVSNLTLINVSADSNSLHGLSFSNGSSGLSVTGGSFSANGTTRGVNGAGINLNADVSAGSQVTSVSIQGSVTANNNATAGILAYAANATDTIKSLTIGQTGTITMTNNGGAGVILYGNIENSSVTGSFTKGAANAAAILVVGIYDLSPSAPVGTSIKRSTFNSGYNLNHPAISLSDLGESYTGTHTCIYNVTADSNQFNVPISGIDSLIWDMNDDSNLGRVSHTHDNALPVELTSFTGTSRGLEVELLWTTATEAGNYGFEVERKDASVAGAGWRDLGFVEGKGTTSLRHDYNYVDRPATFGLYIYCLKQIDRNGNFAYSAQIEVSALSAPGAFSLEQNYPNPFNPSTKIRFEVPSDERVKVRIFDESGRVVSTLFDGFALGKTPYEISFDGEKLSSGVYFYSLETANTREARKMVLLK